MVQATEDVSTRARVNGSTPASNQPEKSASDVAELRARMSTAIEAMISALDMLDAAEADREDDDAAEEDDAAEDAGSDEPSLGSFDRMANQEKSYKQHIGYGSDVEVDRADSEPSLGAIEAHPTVHFTDRTTSGDQTGWANSSSNDREDEHDGREPEDNEPSLGAPEAAGDQRSWARGDDRELEQDDAEREDDDEREPDVDDEPSLGALSDYDGSRHQLGWATGDQLDREDGPGARPPNGGGPDLGKLALNLPAMHARARKLRALLRQKGGAAS